MPDTTIPNNEKAREQKLEETIGRPEGRPRGATPDGYWGELLSTDPNQMLGVVVDESEHGRVGMLKELFDSLESAGTGEKKLIDTLFDTEKYHSHSPLLKHASPEPTLAQRVESTLGRR